MGADGEMYDGAWAAGQRHGLGTCKYPCKDAYRGDWVHGVRSGQGCCLFANGDKYQGEQALILTTTLKLDPEHTSCALWCRPQPPGVKR